MAFPAVKARHILVATQKDANDIIQIANRGNFAQLASERSIGPSKDQGGDLGWFRKEAMIPAFADVAFKTPVGSVASQPVQTQFGWHVIKLEETRIKEAPALDAVRDELRRQVEQDVVKAHIDALVEKANVDTSASEGIDPALLNNIDLLE